MQPPDDDIAILYADDGLSIGQIAEKFQIGKATVWRALRRTNTESRKPSEERLDRAEVIRVFEEKGRSVAETAAHFGVPQFYIRRSLIRSGVYTPRIGSVEHLKPYHKSVDAQFRSEVLAMHRRKLSKAEIARRLNTSTETIRYVLYLSEKGMTSDDTQRSGDADRKGDHDRTTIEPKS